jgi:4-hydroxy-tetrahydrodipicolinate synthase
VGADAVLVVTPYYIRPPQRGLIEYFADIGARTPLPLLVYHIPGRAAVSLTAGTLEQIAARTPTLVGMKHAVNDLSLASDALHRLGPDFRLFVGLEELSFPMLALGASGLMNAVGNLRPAAVAELCDAVAKGDLDTARALHFELLELNRAVFWDTNPIPMKYLMVRMGLLDAPPADGAGDTRPAAPAGRVDRPGVTEVARQSIVSDSSLTAATTSSANAAVVASSRRATGAAMLSPA